MNKLQKIAKHFKRLAEQGTTIGKGTSNPFPNRAEREKEMSNQMVKMTVNLKMDSDVGEPVTVEYDPKKNLQDVTISWGNESHTVDFEAGDVIDDFGNEGSDIETIADSDDGRWQFILDVYVGYQFDMTGDYEEWDFNELIVQHHPENEDHLDPEDRSDYDGPLEEGSCTEQEIAEGTCGYTQTADGKKLNTPGGTKGMSALNRSNFMKIIRETLSEFREEEINPLNEKIWWNYHKCKCESTTMMPDGNAATYKSCCGGSGAPCSSRWDCPKSRKGGQLDPSTIGLVKKMMEQKKPGLCKKGKAYVARRKAAGEKHGAYLMGRAVKVCKGQMSGTKKKKNELKVPHRKSGYMGYSEPVEETNTTLYELKNIIRQTLEEKKKGKCKPSKGKRFAKRVNGKCRSFGQAGKAKKGGDRIRPGTAKAHAYCARSAKIKKCKNPPCANALSRKKWKCQGSRSVTEATWTD